MLDVLVAEGATCVRKEGVQPQVLLLGENHVVFSDNMPNPKAAVVRFQPRYICCEALAVGTRVSVRELAGERFVDRLRLLWKRSRHDELDELLRLGGFGGGLAYEAVTGWRDALPNTEFWGIDIAHKTSVPWYDKVSEAVVRVEESLAGWIEGQDGMERALYKRMVGEYVRLLENPWREVKVRGWQVFADRWCDGDTKRGVSRELELFYVIGSVRERVMGKALADMARSGERVLGIVGASHVAEGSRVYGELERAGVTYCGIDLIRKKSTRQ